MKKEHLILGSLLVLFLGTFLYGPGITTAASNTMAASGSVVPHAEEYDTAAAQAADGSLNVLNRNWDFESADSDGGPQGYDYSVSGYSRMNASYKGDVHSGLYSGHLVVKGSESGSAYGYQVQYFDSYVMYISQQLVLDFYWNALHSPDVSQGANIYVQAQFSNVTSYNLYYYLSVGSSYQGNSTSRTSFFLNESVQQWNHFQRNLLDDFNSRPDWSASSNLYLSSLYFYMNSPSRPSDVTELVYDDVSITNNTAYDYLAGRNGDFESGNGNYWYNSGQSDYGHASLSDTCIHGGKALNLTASQEIDYSYSQAELHQYPGYPSIVPYASDILLLDFDWNYNDVLGGGSQDAYLYLYLSNDTYWAYIYFYLGYSSESSLPSNYTSQPTYSYYYFNASGIGSRGNWMHFHLDLYDLANGLGFSNLGLTQVEIDARSGGHSNAKTQVLIDSFRLICYPTGYPGFEIESDGRTSTNPIPGWMIDVGSTSAFNHTHDARSGSWALNITPGSGANTAIYRTTYFQQDNDSYVDFWWRLDEMISTSSSRAYIEMQYEYNYRIRYYVALDSHYNPTNDSSTVSYILPSVNTTGTWVHTTRNIANDLLEGLGEKDLNLASVYIRAYNDPAGRISVLLDDITIKDSTPPTGSPSAGKSVYYAPTAINVNADDNRAGVRNVAISYNAGSGWSDVAATYQFDHWAAEIPQLAWNTSVHYYVTITDYAGNIYVNNNAGAGFSFVIGDDIAPIVSLGLVEDGAIVSQVVYLVATADDVGGGIDHVELQVDSVGIADDLSAPYQFHLDTWMLTNGSHVVAAVAYDRNGNSANDSLTINVQNDVMAPQLTGLVINPSVPQYDQAVTFSVRATDATGLSNVTLYFRANGGTWATTVLAKSNGDIWSVEMAYSSLTQYNTVVEYYLVAYDSTPLTHSRHLGTATEPFSYTVGDSIAPALGVFGPSPSEPVRGTVQFTIHATDEGSGVHAVEFLVDGKLVSTTTSNVVSWNTADSTNANHTLTFNAIDNAGNVATFTIEYQVQNPEGIGAIGDSLATFMGSYGFFVGAGAVIIVLAIGKVLMKRRSK